MTQEETPTRPPLPEVVAQAGPPPPPSPAGRPRTR